MRQIVLDTETTGLSADSGHRIIEIGCVELIDRELTGKHFHYYLNPQRTVDDGAFRVHGLSNQFLQDKPLFATIAQELLRFIEGAELIIHNAVFDLAFMDAELKRMGMEKRTTDYCAVFDTLVYARQKHPGQKNNLDALCKRYEVDNSNRQYHGALLDAEILAGVYLAMTGGQRSLFEEESANSSVRSLKQEIRAPILTTKTPIISVSATEMAAHAEFIAALVKKSGVDHFTAGELSS